MLIKATLSNARHPEYGEVTIPFPIKTSEYDRIMEMLANLEIGNIMGRDCKIMELSSPYSILQKLEGSEVNIDELDYHATEGYYQNIGEDGFKERDHIRLRDALLSMEGKFLLSYNDDAFIRELYDAPGIQIEPVTRLNNIRQRYDPNSQFAELLIANYDMAERSHATTQINLFDYQKGEFDYAYVF